MTFYLIRNKHTHDWISALDEMGNVRSKGFTHAHLSKDDQPPRLFHSMNAARNALRVWLSGKLIAKHTPYQSMGSLYLEEENVEMVRTPCPERRAEDMEIVPCKIVVTQFDIFKKGNDNAKSCLRIP